MKQRIGRVGSGIQTPVQSAMVLISLACGVLAGLTGVPLVAWLCMPLTLIAGKEGLKSSYRSLVYRKRIDRDVMNSVIVLVFFGNGHFVLAQFPNIQRFISNILVSKTRDQSKSALLDVFSGMPSHATILSRGEPTKIECSRLTPEHTVLVHAGETIPADGRVQGGAALVDESLLTGESQPVEKEKGSLVFAVTMVISGEIFINVEKTGQFTAAAEISKTLSQTVDFKTESQIVAEKRVNQLVKPSLGLALLAWPFIGLSATMAVISAPPIYNMTIAAAVCMLSYLKIASRTGILIKDGRTLDRLSEVDIVVFDKTGTLTEKLPQIGRIFLFAEYGENEVLGVAEALERNQSHPIARSIKKEARSRQIQHQLIESTNITLGFGVSGSNDHDHFSIGSERFLHQQGLHLNHAAKESQRECHQQGGSLVFLTRNQKVIGGFEIKASYRPNARTVIRSLSRYGIKETHLLSGDQEEPTKAAAEALGIDRFQAGVLPREKGAFIDSLQNNGHKVCYVGDGINDSIALKKAHLSVSLEGAATLATDNAQAILMNQDLDRLTTLFEISEGYKNTMTKVYRMVYTPGLVGLVGSLILHFGFPTIVMMNTSGLLFSIWTSTKPGRIHKSIQPRLGRPH